MDLYNAIINNGGKILQDGRAIRDFFSKDGLFIIKQSADKLGNYTIDTFNRSNEIVSSTTKKMAKNGSYSVNTKNYIKNIAQSFNVLKLGESKTGFMSALFKSPINKKAKTGEFMHVVDNAVQVKGEVVHFPFNNSISPQDNKLALKTGIFNKNFGPIKL